MFYLDSEIWNQPQFSVAGAELTDWWKEKCVGFGVANRPDTTGTANTVTFQVVFPLHSTYDRLDELFGLYNQTIPTHLRTVFDSYSNTVFDFVVPPLFADGYENASAKWFSLNVSDLQDQSTNTFAACVGWYDLMATEDTVWGTSIRDETGHAWFNSWLPSPLEEFTGFPGAEELKFVYNKSTGDLVTAKYYGDYRNITFDCTTDPWTHLTEGALEVCTSETNNSLFADPTNVVSEIIAANTGTILLSSGRNNSNNTYLRITPLNLTRAVGNTDVDIEETIVYDVVTMEPIGNVDVKLEVTNEGYRLLELSNLYANGEPTGWYSANTLDDVRIA